MAIQAAKEFLIGLLVVLLIFEIVGIGTCIGNIIFYALNLYNVDIPISMQEKSALLAFNAIVIIIGLFAFILTCIAFSKVEWMAAHYHSHMYKSMHPETFREESESAIERSIHPLM